MYNKLYNKTNNFLKENIQFCKFCGKECHNLNSLKQHECRCKLNPDRITIKGGNQKNYKPVCAGWNKGLTKETNTSIAKSVIKVKDFYKNHPGYWTGKKHTTESKQKISQKMKGNHYNDPSKTGRGKKGYYKGFYCSSTYELAFIIYCLDHKIPVKKCNLSYTYYWKNKKHKYYPDFMINETIYEIKGFWTQQVEEKTKSVQDREIQVLYRNDMKNIFDYIEEKYGKKVDKNIHELYE